MIHVKTYNTVPGLNYIYDPALAYAGILKVKREGLSYDITDNGAATGTRRVNYEMGTGYLQFGSPHAPGARVYVLYQT